MSRNVFALAFLALLSCGRHEAPARPNVILISIDTLRSDHVGSNTPNINAFAADSIAFDRAFSHVPLTLPSHLSIFTGLLPAHHRVRDNAGMVLDAKTPTIASMLREQGYATGGAVSAYVLRSSTNANLGFNDYDDAIPFIEGAPTGNLTRDGRETIAIAKQWIANHAAQPFFAFVHLFEPHAPYAPTYDADVATADRYVGELLQSLRDQKLYDDALIILLSDHGEGLRDHGEQEHGVLLYREALQVPLFVKLPRNERGGTHVADSVQLVDVLPTIAAVTGATAPKNDGRSLLAQQTARPHYAETLYPRIHLGWSELHSVIEWPHHLIEGPKPELYDLARDARELRDVRDADRRAYAKLRHDLAAAPQAELTATRISPEEAKKLAALGYVSASTSAAKSNLNPRDHLGDLDALKRVTELMAAHRYAEAAKEMEPLLARNPGWSDLRNDLGLAYENIGDFARAERVYRDAIAATPELAPDFALSLAGVLFEQRKFDDAAAHARLALQTNPKGAHELLAQVAFARGDLDTALREAQSAQSDLLLAQIHLARNDPRAALEAMRRIRPPLPRGYYTVAGDVLLVLGRAAEAADAFQRALRADPNDALARERLAMLNSR